LLTLFDTPVAKISTDFCLLQSKRAHAAPAGTLRTAAQLHGHTQQRKRALRINSARKQQELRRERRRAQASVLAT